MSVLIKGMEMPTRCGECPLSLYSHSPCWKNGGALDWEHRPNWCPLVPVPPHGRLIDADAPIPLVDTHGKNIEVTVAHIIEENFGVVNVIIEAEEGEQ